jgi:hypothetical protein
VVKKAQVWSYDLIIGSILFLIALGILAFFWWSVTTTISRNEEKIFTESLKFSDVLLTPGIPETWSVDPEFQETWDYYVQQIGLTTNTSKRTLEPIKVGSFYGMGAYNYSGAKLKAKSHYDYYLTLTRHDGIEKEITVYWFGSYNSTGLDPISYNAKTIVKTERIVIFRNEIVRFKLLSWTDQVWD